MIGKRLKWATDRFWQVITEYKIRQTHPGERLWYSGSGVQRIQERGEDPNDLIFLSVYQGNLLIEDLAESQRLLGEDIERIQEAQEELKSLLPENYSPPWSYDGNCKLINRATGRHYHPEDYAKRIPLQHIYKVNNPPNFRP